MTKIALTALTELWYEDEDFILLGDWCETIQNRELRNRLSCKVLDHRFESKELQKTHYALDAFADRLVKAIGRALNELFNESHNDKYWYYIYKSWVIEHVLVWYQRYRMLTDVAEKYGGFETRIFKTDKYPRAVGFMSDVGEDDYYNLMIYSRILDQIKNSYGISVEYIEDHQSRKTFEPKAVSQDKYYHPSNSIAKRLYKKLFYRSRVYGQGTVMSDAPRRLKAVTLGRVFWDWDVSTGINIRAYDFDYDLRAQIRLELEPDNEFEKIIISNIVYDMPVTGLEAYQDIISNIKDQYKYTPKAMITYSLGGLSQDGILIAYLQALGTKIYSASRYSDPFLLNRAFFYSDIINCDREYIPALSDDPRVVRTPMYTYAARKRSRDSYERKYIRWFERAETEFRYREFRAYKQTDSENMKKTRQVYFDCLRGLDKETAEILVYRYREYDSFGMDVLAREIHPEITIDYGFQRGEQVNSYGGKVTEILYDTKIAICETLSTTVFFEAIVRGIPTIVLNYNYDDEACYDRDLLDYQKRLKELGVIYDDGHKAAEFLNNCADFDKWWNEPIRKSLIDELIDKYAFHLDDTYIWWKTELFRICREVRENK